MSSFKKHVIVVGSARSGTSWLSETLAQPYRYRMLFEPEQETRTKKGHLICDKWLNTETVTQEAHTYLKRVFQNRVDCDWIAQNSNRKFKRHLWPFLPKKYIIKFVRANLAAHYMNTVFAIPLIHIIRNPYDVICSQQQVKFPWLYDLSHFVKQDRLVELIKRTYAYDITQFSNLNHTEILALRWCIENVIPLEVFKPYFNKALVVRYEELFNNLDMFYDICSRFNLEPVDDLKAILKQPSSKTHPNSTLHKAPAKKKNLTSVEVDQVSQILDVFKTELYSKTFLE
ncbi:sulfotransferase domain-containing protein [Hanstruepera flava]|uniref:sulfotransferase domain-containing protein n=1 Tax=Hanstruepera flava TaxID=2930218 RepID=UPI00202773CD|nr:sulfotransferase domain-containing protein [Hanstruepera flava]